MFNLPVDTDTRVRFDYIDATGTETRRREGKGVLPSRKQVNNPTILVLETPTGMRSFRRDRMNNVQFI